MKHWTHKWEHVGKIFITVTNVCFAASEPNLKSFQSTPCLDELAQPTNTTDPTLQCVVLIGIPIFEARRTVNAAPISIVNPLKAETSLSRATAMDMQPWDEIMTDTLISNYNSSFVNQLLYLSKYKMSTTKQVSSAIKHLTCN
jgi:hypothetical protein